MAARQLRRQAFKKCEKLFKETVTQACLREMGLAELDEARI